MNSYLAGQGGHRRDLDAPPVLAALLLGPLDRALDDQVQEVGHDGLRRLRLGLLDHHLLVLHEAELPRRYDELAGYWDALDLAREGVVGDPSAIASEFEACLASLGEPKP